MSKVEVKVPDIGDFEDVEVIEVLVSAGDTIEVDDSLITLESDKSSMEIPAEQAGKVTEVTVAVGDTVSEGDVIAYLETDSAGGDGGDGGDDDSEDADDADASAGSGDDDETAEESSSGGGGGGEKIEVPVPDIGDSERVEVIEVLVSVGDVVEVEQSLITLESDKASMEVPSPAAGKVESISVSVGDEVDEGDPLCVLIGEADSGGDAGDKGDGERSADTSKRDGEKASSDGSKSGSTSGGKPSGDSSGTSGGASKSESSGRARSPTEDIPDERIRKAHASPSVRRYARIHGADLSKVEGSGPKDRILEEDVRAFIKQTMESGGGGGKAAAGGASEGSGIPPIPEVDFSKFGEFEQEKRGRIPKLSGRNLHRAWLNLPMVTHHEECDVTDMEAFRSELKKTAKEGDPKVTGLAFHMKALVQCLKAFPKFNSSLSADGESLVMKKYFHIGIAVDTPNGLMVPVFRDVDRMSIHELADAMADKSVRARDGKLKGDEMQGACMTISSIGGIGGVGFTPIVNPPEVAILGITRARMQPVWDGKDFEPRLMCPLDLTYDHRVIDGADAARFMVHYCQLMGDIRRLLL